MTANEYVNRYGNPQGYRPSLLDAAKALLERIDNITTDEFSKGGEHDEREALRLAITEAERAA